MGNLGIRLIEKDEGPIVRVCDICGRSTTEVVYKNEFLGENYCVCIKCLSWSNEKQAVIARRDLTKQRRKRRIGKR